MTDTIPDIEGVSHRTVRARGLDFHVAEAGSGEDVLLCLHGWPQHWYEWRAVLPALADRHRVLALDLRGFGWSDAPPDGYDKENMATDVLAVMDELGLDRVGLLGHDWGGWIGFLLCMRSPQRFRRFLALNILHPWVERRRMARESWRFAYQQLIASPWLGYRLHRDGRFVRRILVGASKNRAVWDERTLSIFADTFTEPARARAGVQMYRTFHLREMLPIARGRYAGARISVPTRFLFGEDDPALRPRLLAGADRHIDDVEIELVPQTGHFIVDERPDLVVQRARSIFAPGAS